MGKKVMIYILSFILSLGIFCVLALAIISNTILNKQCILDTLQKNDYYEKTYIDIQEGIHNYAMQSGLEQEVFENLYTGEKVTQDIGKVIDGIYNNKEVKIDTQEIRQTLDNRIDKVLEEHQKKPDQKEKDSIQKLEDVICETYTSGIMYSNEIAEKISEPLQIISKTLEKLFIAGMIVTCVLLLVIGIMGKKEMLSYLGISFITSGTLSILLQPLVGDRIHYILILNTAFSECVRYMMNHILQMFSIIGGVLIVIGLISSVLGNYIHKRDITG